MIQSQVGLMSLSTFQRTVGLKISDVPLQNNNFMIWLCTVQQTQKKTFYGVF